MHNCDFAVIGKIFGVGLKKNPCEQSIGILRLDRRRIVRVVRIRRQLDPVPEPFNCPLPPGRPFCATLRRLGPAEQEQHAGSLTETPGNSEGGEKDLIRRVGDGRRKSWANPRELFQFPRTGFSEMPRGERKSADLQRRMDKWKPVRWRDGCGDPTSAGIIVWVGIYR